MKYRYGGIGGGAMRQIGYRDEYGDPDAPNHQQKFAEAGVDGWIEPEHDTVAEEMAAEDADLAARLEAQGVKNWHTNQEKRNQRNQKNAAKKKEFDKKQTEFKQKVIAEPVLGDKIELERHNGTHETYEYDGLNFVSRSNPERKIRPHYHGEDDINTPAARNKAWESLAGANRHRDEKGRIKGNADSDPKNFEDVDPEERKHLSEQPHADINPNKQVIIIMDKEDKRFPKALTKEQMKEVRDLDTKKKTKESLDTAHRFETNRKGQEYEEYRKSHQQLRDDQGYWAAQRAESKQQRERRHDAFTHGRLEGSKDYGAGGSVGIAHGTQEVIRTNRWERIDPQDKTPSSLEFTLSALPQRVRGNEDDGTPYEEGQNLQELLNDHGIRGSIIRTDDDNFTYKVKLEEGQIVNPDQAKAFASDLDLAYDAKGNAQFHREGPAMRRRRVVVNENQKNTPAWVNAGTFSEANVIKTAPDSRMEGRSGLRDKEGNLYDGQQDAINFRLKLPGQDQDQRVYWQLKDDTDGMGWGTSYRPGSKEVSDVALAGTRWHQQADLHEAYLAHQNGDDSLIEKMVSKQFPEAADDDEKAHWKGEMLELGAAGGAAAAYTARKTAKTRGVHTAINKISPKAYNFLNDRAILPAVEYAYVRPAGQKLDRALWRLRHPMHDPMRPHLSPIELNLRPEISSLKYRNRFFLTDKVKKAADEENLSIKGYQHERRVDAEAVRIAETRHNINKAMDGEIEGRERWMRLHSSDAIMNKSKDIHFDTRWERMTKDPKKYGLSDEHLKLNTAVDETRLKNIKHDVKASKIVGPDGRHLKMAGKAGMYGVGAAAVVGAGVYAYDKHKQKEIAAGTYEPSKLKERIPETIKVPRAQVQISKEYKIPVNVGTDALDIQGKKVPYGWKVSNNPKEIRLRNFKDVSGEGYKSAPVVGRVRVGAPVKNDGDWAESLMYKQKENGAGQYMETNASVKNKYNVEVAGRDTNIYVQIGDKERYKRGDLKQTNPNKLTQTDREKIAATILLEGPKSEELRAYYGDDQRVMDMVKKEVELRRAAEDSGQAYLPGLAGRHNYDTYDYYGYEKARYGPTFGKGEHDREAQSAMEMSPQQRDARKQEFYEEVARRNKKNQSVFEGTVEDAQRQRDRNNRPSQPYGGTLHIPED